MDRIPIGTRVCVGTRRGRSIAGAYGGQYGTVIRDSIAFSGMQWVLLDNAQDDGVILYTDELIQSLDEDEDEPIEQMMNRKAPLGAGASVPTTLASFRQHRLVGVEAAAASSSSAAAAASVSPPSSTAASLVPVVVTPAVIARYCEWARTTRTGVVLSDTPVVAAGFMCPHCMDPLRHWYRTKIYICALCERKWDSSRDHFPTLGVTLEEAAAQRVIVAVPNTSLGTVFKEMQAPPSYEEASEHRSIRDLLDDEKADAEQKKARRALKRKSKEDKDASNKSQRL